MANNAKHTKAGTNVENVKKANQAAQQGKYGTEFAEATDVQQVKKKNQQSQNNKK